MTLATDLLPLYLVVAAGFLLGKFVRFDSAAISAALVYVITPVTVGYGVAVAPHHDEYLLIPVLYFLISLAMSLIFYGIGRLVWQGSEKNLLGAAAGSGNTGFFGLPLVLMVAGPEGLSIVAFVIMGGALYQSTCGYYIIARGHLAAKDALLQVAKLPLLYAFVLGLVINRLDYRFGAAANGVFEDVKGTYVILGMMVIGTILATADRTAFDLKFTALAFIAKFAAFPALVGATIFLDDRVTHIFDRPVHTVLVLLSVVPMASLTINYAALLKTKPEKIAITVTASTVFALVYVPVFVAIALRT
jgi:predicted permease